MTNYPILQISKLFINKEIPASAGMTAALKF